MHEKVVITGMGAVTPVGLGVGATWRALAEGRSGIGPITKFDASAFDSRIAGVEGKLAGVVGLHGLDQETQSAMFHYFIGEAFTGHGLITRTCRAMVDELFQEALWGADAEAATRRANVRADIGHAWRFLTLSSQP